MIRRKENPSTYYIVTARNRYAVTIDRLKNDINGNPRFTAVIIELDHNSTAYSDFYSVRFNFSGHYLSDKDEAAAIVKYYESTQYNQNTPAGEKGKP